MQEKKQDTKLHDLDLDLHVFMRLPTPLHVQRKNKKD